MLNILHIEVTSLVAQMVKRLPTVQETWVQSLDQEDLLEKGMATHSRILAWKILWTEEPGRLQSMGSQSRTQLSDFTFTKGLRGKGFPERQDLGQALRILGAPEPRDNPTAWSTHAPQAGSRLAPGGLPKLPRLPQGGQHCMPTYPAGEEVARTPETRGRICKKPR